MARPTTMAGRKIVSLPPDLERAVDDFRFENRFPSESEAIRRLIELGLEAATRKAKPPDLTPKPPST
jgi:Arc/MetJ-type ribon-helix-helix transcriptional regulator